MNNNMSGKISMNPKELYNVTLTGVDLESRVSDNFQKMNDAFESILQAVKTPELNQKVVALYDIFKQVETNFNQNNRIVNDFFSKKLQEYNEHAINITEASSNLSSNLGFTNSGSNINGNTFTSSVGLSKGAINNESATLDIKKNSDFVNNGSTADSGVISLDPREWEGFNKSDI